MGKSDYAEAAELLNAKGLKTQASFFKRLAKGKQKAYVIMRATPDCGHLQWGPTPIDEDYCTTLEYPTLYMNRATAQKVALQATIQYVRSTPLCYYSDGMWIAAQESGFESKESASQWIAETIQRPFSEEDELLAPADVPDAAISKVILEFGYHKYRADSVYLSI